MAYSVTPRAPADVLATYRSCCDKAGVLPDVSTLSALSEGSPTLCARGNSAVLAVLDLLSSGKVPHVSSLHFGGRPLRPDTIVAIATFLRENNRSVSELKIPKARLRDEGSSALLAGLLGAGKRSPLRKLDFRGNKLSTPTALALSAAMTDPVTSGGIARLTHLDVSNNYLGTDGIEALQTSAAARGKSEPIEMRHYGNHVLVEILNGVTHGVGLLVALVMGSILVYRSSQTLPVYQTVSLALYVASLCTMFLSSCLYHCFFRLPGAQRFWHTADHCSIFILIAGSYTPFVTCYTLDPLTVAGPIVLAVVWISAIVGVLISFKVIRAPDKVRTFLALAIGWSGLCVVETVFLRMSTVVVSLVVAGGVAYSGGIGFYLAGKKKPVMHVYWHLAVMLGGALHMIALWHVVTIRAIAAGLPVH